MFPFCQVFPFICYLSLQIPTTATALTTKRVMRAADDQEYLTVTPSHILWSHNFIDRNIDSKLCLHVYVWCLCVCVCVLAP